MARSTSPGPRPAPHCTFHPASTPPVPSAPLHNSRSAPTSRACMSLCRCGPIHPPPSHPQSHPRTRTTPSVLCLPPSTMLALRPAAVHIPHPQPHTSSNSLHRTQRTTAAPPLTPHLALLTSSRTRRRTLYTALACLGGDTRHDREPNQLPVPHGPRWNEDDIILGGFIIPAAHRPSVPRLSPNDMERGGA
ncbi:hypothetical protein B0H17DRAFT_1201436 [Mycena rosella]|uniref:Uncharacterized protein n=1 Tax=Mycena rosella TaxID=1033263 RepID=A0AAD7DG32_MYCRO|nr:hypothetical protein B0H17DRAFT_1201436 [Mycena rosella]